MIRNVIGQLQRVNGIQTTMGIRFVSNAKQKLTRNHNDLKFLPEEELSAFKSYFPTIVEDATRRDPIVSHQPVYRRLEKLLTYYGPNGKFLRQHVFIYGYKMIENNFGTFDPKYMEQVYKLAWCLEMFNIQFMILDDILDNHEIRRGKKSWYKLDGVGLNVISDSYLLQNSMFQLLEKYFSSHPNYTFILQNFLRLDLTISWTMEFEKNPAFTFERLGDLAQIKTTYYVLGQPFQLATLLSGKGSYLNDMLKKVFEYFGLLYTIQNDMLDCYGEDFGAKPGTDIQENRCAAPIVLALAKASPQQRKQLEECYGTRDDAKVKKVKQIFEELDVIGEYYTWEKKIHDNISEEIANIPDDFARSLIRKYAYIYTFGEIGTPPV